MSGGYGSGGYPGQGYDEDPRRGYGSGGYPGQGYDEDPRQDPRRRQAGYYESGYDPEGYDPQGYDQYGGTGGTPQYDGPQYDGPQYEDPRYEDPRYDQRQGTGARRTQGRAQGGPQGRARDDYDQRGGGNRRRRAYSEWDADESDSSFLPGFDGRGDYGDGRGDYDDGRYAPERDDRRAPRGGYPEGRGPGDRGPDQRGPGGPGGRGPADDRDRPADRSPFPDDDWDDRSRRPRKRVTRWFPRILVLTVVAVVLIGGGIGGLDVYHKYEARYHPADYVGPGTGDVTVQVASGATAFSLAPELLKLGVIASTRAFTNAAEAATNTAGTTSKGLEAGYFQLHYHMQASLAYAALLNPKNVVQTTVVIPEGERVSQVLSILSAKTKIPLAQFEAAAKETSKLGLPSYAGTKAKLPSTVPYGQLEGYLFPATYAITPHETALQILQAMVQRFNIEAEQINITQAAKSVGLTPGQLITEASMVQAEAGTDADMPKMASVINNRTKAGMPDGFDSVVFYGLGKFGINIPDTLNPATAGPYDNTQDTGLPPTPIDNPGDTAIQAILHPAHTDYLYFLTVGTGKPTKFSANCQDLPGTCG